MLIKSPRLNLIGYDTATAQRKEKEDPQTLQEEAEAEVKTSCVVDLGVPAAQQEGEDGQKIF